MIEELNLLKRGSVFFTVGLLHDKQWPLAQGEFIQNNREIRGPATAENERWYMVL
jgi:hypothetical protein